MVMVEARDWNRFVGVRTPPDDPSRLSRNHPTITHIPTRFVYTDDSSVETVIIIRSEATGRNEDRRASPTSHTCT